MRNIMYSIFVTFSFTSLLLGEIYESLNDLREIHLQMCNSNEFYLIKE